MMLSEAGRGLNYESMPNWRPVQSAPCLSPYGQYPPKYWWHQRDITWLKWKWIQFGFFDEWYETVSFGIKFGNIFDLFNDPRFSYKLFAANYQTSSRLPFFVNMICNLFFHLDQREICLKKINPPLPKSTKSRSNENINVTAPAPQI